ncbi:hypothetical protein RF11_06949 [Thelohanellus kitauei]|uniref:Transmembrane protein n=1 Tax=Thelohanellus kitauei TaxID=669202 RepID=A0A0C2M4G3_THEKT|nr:hypothetical protein RF11_06949 [Thelohanellus kitauei]
MAHSHMVFVVLMVVAFLFAAQLIVTSLFPAMFTLVIKNQSKHEVATFGPLYWSIQGEPRKYQSVTVLFGFIQVMYAATSVASIIALYFAIPGYVIKRLQRLAGRFILAATLLQCILASSYTVQYVWARCGGKFLSTEDNILLMKLHSEEFPVPSFMFSVWSMMFSFLALGLSVLNRKFTYEKMEIDAE